MDTISWRDFISDKYLMGITFASSLVVIAAVYISYLGIKFSELSRYIPMQNMIYLGLTVFVGFAFLGEKITQFQIIGVILAGISIYLIKFKLPSHQTPFVNVE